MTKEESEAQIYNTTNRRISLFINPTDWVISTMINGKGGLYNSEPQYYGFVV
ncbi:hypothetical protein HN51_023272, partial [Arachis hypogaea]